MMEVLIGGLLLFFSAVALGGVLNYMEFGEFYDNPFKKKANKKDNN